MIADYAVNPSPRLSPDRTAAGGESSNSIHKPDPLSQFLNATQENPDLTSAAGLQTPIRTVNRDMLNSSTSFPKSDLRFRPKSFSISPNSPQFQDQAIKSFSSIPHHSPSLGMDESPGSERAKSISHITSSRDRSFWFSWLHRSRISSDIMPNLSSDDIAHRTSPFIHRSGMVDENSDRSFSARIFGHSLRNQVPNFILFCGIILIVVIASSYLLLKDKHSNVGKIAGLCIHLVIGNNFDPAFTL